MEILSCGIDWYKGYGNLPTLKVTVDRIPPADAFRYRVVPYVNGTRVWGEKEGLVRLFAHVPGNERGYGGCVFTVTDIDDGVERKFKGPWSSNAADMNQVFPPVSEVIVYERDGEFPNLGCGYHMVAAGWIDLCRSTGASVAVIRQYGGERGKAQLAMPEEEEVIREVMAHPEVSLGRYLDFVPLWPGTHDLEYSQQMKNKQEAD
jgi:hypothetical protein